jgi:hypothetical protein
MSNNLIDEAEFLLHLAEENSITRLRNLLQEATAERALPILRRIINFTTATTQKCCSALPFAVSIKDKMTRLSPSQDGLESLNPTTIKCYALRFFSQPHAVRQRTPRLLARDY